MPKRTTEIRSEEVQEILNRIPNWMVRWGITLIFVLLLMVLFLAGLIRYPDTIQGKVTLTTQTPPVKLVSHTSGTLEQIYVADGICVDKGTLIAKITNPVSDHALAYLQRLLGEVQESLNNLPNPKIFATIPAHDHLLGDMQEEYNNLMILYQDYDRLVKSGYHQTNIRGISQQIENHKRLASIIEQQLVYLKKELVHEEERYNAYQKIYAGGGMAKFEFFDKEACYVALQQTLGNKQQEHVKNAITIKACELQLQELSFSYDEKLKKLKASICASIQNIRNRIQQWQQRYTLTAPFSGTVSYLRTFSAKQSVNSGEALFALIPKEEQYIAYMQVPSQGYGKIKPGYKARIKLAPYPHQEYGYLPATVKKLSPLPNKAQYRVALQVDKRLISTHGKVLSFKPEMDGWAEIITEDVSFLQRIVYKFLGLSKR